MKILRIISSAHASGGGPIEGIIRSSEALADLDVEVELATLDSPTESWLSSLPLTVHALGPGLGRYRYSSRLVPWIKANSSRFDKIIIDGIWQFNSYGSYLALKDRQSYYVFPHGMLDPWFRKTYPLKHFKKSLYWPWAEHKVLSGAKAVLFTSEDEKLQAREAFNPYRISERVVSYGTLAPSGDRAEMREMFWNAYPTLRGKKILLFVGRIHPKKGCDLLIEAFARAIGRDPDWHLVIAGPDQIGWLNALQRKVEKLDLSERVHWPGMISGDLKWGAFLAAEAFVLPSHQENFGMVVAEALACGLPTIISDKVNIWREIERANCGIVSGDTVEGTTESLRRWLALSRDQVSAMRENATACFEDHFEIQRAVESLLEAIDG